MRKKLLRILAAAMCVCMVATACGGSKNEESKDRLAQIPPTGMTHLLSRTIW